MKRNKLEQVLDKLVKDNTKLLPGQKRKINKNYYLIRLLDGSYTSEKVK